jgi:hypothetical protein
MAGIGRPAEVVHASITDAGDDAPHQALVIASPRRGERRWNLASLTGEASGTAEPRHRYRCATTSTK